MSPKRPTEPTVEEQRLLGAWRTFFESNCKADFAALSSIEDSVWGFEIQWDDLDQHIHQFFEKVKLQDLVKQDLN